MLCSVNLLVYLFTILLLGLSEHKLGSQHQHTINLIRLKWPISEGEQILFLQPPTKKLCDEDLVKHIYYTRLLQIKALITFTKLYNLRQT